MSPAPAALAEAAQVGGDHAAASRQGVDLAVPGAVVQGKAMDEHERAAPPAIDIVEFSAVDGGGWHGVGWEG